MKEQKQKIYLLLSIGITLFFMVGSVLLFNLFNDKALKLYSIEQIEIANITTQSADIFWKGYTQNDSFKLLYKDSSSTGAYKEVTPRNIYEDETYSQGYMFNVNMDDLEPNTKYLGEIWNGDIRLSEFSFTTLSVQQEIDVPQPISGTSFVFDWIKISNEDVEYIVKTDSNGSWALDGNLIGDDYTAQVYASSMVKETNTTESYLFNKVYAAEEANCDEITYPGVPAGIKNKAATFENLLKMNGGTGGNPQYVRCYQDAYCEAEKYGVNGQWTLADWAHESNASDYEFPGSSLYEDFGVHCCGVPSKNFQAQLGFFLSLSHDPCGLGSSGTKEEYYCCWANNYLNGAKSTQCTDQTRAYLNSLMGYYYWVSESGDPGTFDGRLSGLPSRIKTSTKSVSCGPTDSVEVYENGGEIPDNGGADEDPTADGICCALKVTGDDKLRGDYEDVSNKSCDQIWEEGRNLYGGTLQYSVELNGDLDRNTCEKWWDGVCCEDSGELEWIPERNCTKKVDEYDTYYSCKNAGGDKIDVKLELGKGYNFVGWNASDTSDPMLASNILSNSSVVLVAGFKDGVWNRIMYKEGESIKGADFELEKGNGYLITTTKEIDISYSGREIVDFDWGSLEGWQFVSSEVLRPSYNTKAVVLSFDEADISQVALWNYDLGKFLYYVYDTSGEEYGDSVRLNSNQGVFVKTD